MTPTSASPWCSPTAARSGSATSASSVGWACTPRTTTRSTGSGRSRSTRGSRCAPSGRGSGGRRARLKPLLVDQAFVAGVGNIYADEALWRSRLHPLRSAASLRPHDERALYRNVLEILSEAVERRGSSIDDYTAPDGDGEMQERLDVYQRTGRPCPRCGRPIRRIVIGIRATHFCSFCQRLPAADRPGAARLLATMTPRPGRAASGPAGTAVGRSRRGRRAGPDGRRGGEGPRARGRTKAAAAARRAAARAARGSLRSAEPPSMQRQGRARPAHG